jgi:hypothetical protein
MVMLLALLSAVVALPMSGHAAISTNLDPDSIVQIAESQQPAHDLEQRGKALRAELDRSYQKLVRSHEIAQGTDLTEVVLRYIPIGTSFDEAESVLHGAGFVVRPRPNLNVPEVNRARDWYAVIAKLALASNLVAVVDLYISLLPRSPGDYSDISKVSARIYYATL